MLSIKNPHTPWTHAPSFVLPGFPSGLSRFDANHIVRMILWPTQKKEMVGSIPESVVAGRLSAVVSAVARGEERTRETGRVTRLEAAQARPARAVSRRAPAASIAGRGREGEAGFGK
jgi:hypothetical protein